MAILAKYKFRMPDINIKLKGVKSQNCEIKSHNRLVFYANNINNIYLFYINYKITTSPEILSRILKKTIVRWKNVSF